MKKKIFSREIILSEAISLAKKVGFKKLTMRSLANSLNSSVMPIYDAFSSKEILIEEVYNEIIRDNIKSDNYFDRNREVLLNGIRSPSLYRDVREYGSRSYEFNQLYLDTIKLMMHEAKFENFSLQACESLHFDISIYITGLVERKINQNYEIPDHENYCIDTLNQFTEVLIMGYEKALMDEEN